MFYQLKLHVIFQSEFASRKIIMPCDMLRRRWLAGIFLMDPPVSSRPRIVGLVTCDVESSRASFAAQQDKR